MQYCCENKYYQYCAILVITPLSLVFETNMSNCLNCGKGIVQTEGRRSKLYCNSVCRATYHQKKNGGKVRWIPIEKYNELLAKVTENNKPENKIKIEAERNTISEVSKAATNPLPESEAISVEQKDKIERLRVLEAEIKAGAPKNLVLGARMWTQSRLNEIDQLKNQLQG
jgi:hypothetical protein